jgi:hypothetical protein
MFYNIIKTVTYLFVNVFFSLKSFAYKNLNCNGNETALDQCISLNEPFECDENEAAGLSIFYLKT